MFEKIWNLIVTFFYYTWWFWMIALIIGFNYWIAVSDLPDWFKFWLLS